MCCPPTGPGRGGSLSSVLRETRRSSGPRRRCRAVVNFRLRRDRSSFSDRQFGRTAPRRCSQKHRHHHRRLRRGATAVHLRRLLVGLRWRTAPGRRSRRQHLDVRQHGELLGEGDRGGEPPRAAGLRVSETGGAGKFRGGMPQRKTSRMLADEGILQVPADRQTPLRAMAAVPAPRGATYWDPDYRPSRSCTKLTMTPHATLMDLARIRLPDVAWCRPVQDPRSK